MIEIRQTKEFARWLDDLADSRPATKIAQRLVRLEAGLFGDVKPVGGGISELRVDYGPDYRLYFTQGGRTLIVLLCGGDKRQQDRDIALAKVLAKGLKDDLR